VKLTLIGGLLLVVGLFLPWYYESHFSSAWVLVVPAYYEMNALGGSLVNFKEEGWILTPNPLYFDLTIAYLSVIFALFSVFFPLASMKLAEKSQRKWIAVVSLLGGVAALANILYVHSWLGWYYPDGLLFYSDATTSRGPLLGYFLTWVAVAVLFASTYVSEGLTQVLPAKAKEIKEARINKNDKFLISFISILQLIEM
jgi:hypothetical protein